MKSEESSLEAAFSDDPALIPYVVAGDPNPEATKEYVRALAKGGADVVELGLPFSEPIADGPTIQNAIQRALDAGMTPNRYLELVADLDVDVPIVCMTYYNLVYQYGDTDGVEPFVKAAADAGLSGLIVPDLPVEESGPLRSACDDYGLDLVFIVAPTTTDERRARIVSRASGFVYVQARLGTTGAQMDVSGATHESLARLADTDLPKAVGFGVSEGEHAREIVSAGADGVVVGSALVDIIASDEAVETIADRLESKAAELKSGAREGRHEVPESEHT
ncbi:tryptophan synthase subunit alpha [Haladaptatus sp. NG-SE-30]